MAATELKPFKALLPASQTALKRKAFEFLEKGNMHQVLRKEIIFGLVPTTLTPGTDQQQAIMHVLKLLTRGGFFRNNGLNSLPSIKKLAKILNFPNGFKTELKVEAIVSLCQRGIKFSTQLFLSSSI